MKLARVFPRRTRATPDDEHAFTRSPMLADYAAGYDAVHISVTFTWDLPQAERLAELWSGVAPVTIGGPAVRGNVAGEFTPGVYLRRGYTITSRGCPNRCPHCFVPHREGKLVELPIRDGNNVLDNNLLACSERHIRDVFAMLKRQPGEKRLTGGLEAARLREWHVDLLADLKPRGVFFAYDHPSRYEALREAGRMLARAFSRESHVCQCYVLVGYSGDTIYLAERRCREAWAAGFLPMAMLWRGESGEFDPGWRRWQRQWANHVITASKLKEASA